MECATPFGQIIQPATRKSHVRPMCRLTLLPNYKPAPLGSFHPSYSTLPTAKKTKTFYDCNVKFAETPHHGPSLVNPLCRSQASFGGMAPSIPTPLFSTKQNGMIQAYSAITSQGLFKNYNEDRVSIILNISKPKMKNCANWPNVCFFGLYDGHGGTACADYLRDHLHLLIVEDDSFPTSPETAIRNGFMKAERGFLSSSSIQNGTEKSGSCALLCLIVNNTAYIANVGDSRAVMSKCRGKKLVTLTKDHKPTLESEQCRIIANGGHIYKAQVLGAAESMLPYRVFPGRLSVSRTIGDPEAKLHKFKGNPKVVIAEPDISSFKLEAGLDFIVLGCDGIFDKLSNQEVVNAAWKAFENWPDQVTIHPLCGEAGENILRASMEKRTWDNVTAVVIAFEGAISSKEEKKREPKSKLLVLRKCKKWTVTSNKEEAGKAPKSAFTKVQEKAAELPVARQKIARANKFDKYYRLLNI